MHYDLIEIGCCDFDLHPIEPGQRALRIEPVKRYFDRLPQLPSVTNFRCCVSDSVHDVVMIKFVAEKYLHKYPEWMRGCNKISDFVEHREWHKWKIPPVEFDVESVFNFSILDIFNMFGITSVGYLKIDTEGYDEEIIESLFKSTYIRPEVIDFEHKYFTERRKVKDYKLVKFEPSSTIIKHQTGCEVLIG